MIGLTLEGLDNDFKFDCCSDSEKVTIKVVNRGGQNSGFRGEHIDLIETEVLAIVSVSGYEGQLDDVLADRQIRDSELLQDFYKLTLSDAFFTEPGSALCPTNCKGKSFIARNNYIGNNRARGISTKAENGIMGRAKVLIPKQR